MYFYDLLVRLAIALLVGFGFGLVSYFLGQRNAGIRVFVIISLGCSLTTFISVNSGIMVKQPWMADPGRITAQLVSAVGFMVAGIIWYRDNRAKGLSSAALLWVTAIIGIMIGAGFYRETVVAVVTVALILLLVEFRYNYWG